MDLKETSSFFTNQPWLGRAVVICNCRTKLRPDTRTDEENTYFPMIIVAALAEGLTWDVRQDWRRA
jgi:hypothetical protein